ncbi:ubiquitin-conjugating enzyme subfamily protein, partial [Toxoplasma gondii MAS]
MSNIARELLKKQFL